MFLYQLVNFNNAADSIAKKIRCECKTVISQGYRWIEWSEDIKEIAPAPDISIVYAEGMEWRELLASLTEVRSLNVVLLGNQTGLLALPYFEKRFSVLELNRLMAKTIENAPGPRQKRSNTNWVETMPMPLPSPKSVGYR